MCVCVAVKFELDFKIPLYTHYICQFLFWSPYIECSAVGFMGGRSRAINFISNTYLCHTQKV